MVSNTYSQKEKNVNPYASLTFRTPFLKTAVILIYPYFLIILGSYLKTIIIEYN